jgi:hypothetical protein
MEVYMNDHELWLESFEKPGDKGISYFQNHYGYERLNSTVDSNDIRAVLCHQYPFLKDNQELLQECIKLCNGSYRNNGPKVREFIYNKHIKLEKKKGKIKMEFSWKEPLTYEEERNIKEFILYIYEALNKWGNDRHIDHILHYMVRDVTRIIGEYKNLKISSKAKELIGECHCFKDIIKAKKRLPSGKIVLDHNPTAKSFFDELTRKKGEKEHFTHKDADRWLNEATIVVITKDEDRLLTSKGYMEDRPSDAYDKLGIKTINVWRHK